MAIKLLENIGIENTGIGASALNNLITGNKSGIVGNYLNECAFTATGNTIIIDKGLLIICGRQVEIDAIESITLASVPSEDVRYQIVIELIREETGEVTASIFARQPSTLIQENLMKDGFVYQFELGRVTHTTSGNLEDIIRTADILTSGSIGGADFEIGEVITETLAEGLDAEVDIEKRQVDNKQYIDFSFSIPKGYSGFARVYKGLTELDGITTSSTIAQVCEAMVDNSVLIASTSGYTALLPTGETDSNGLLEITRVNLNRVKLFWSYSNASKQPVYVGVYRNTVGFSGWKQIFTADNISTTMPISSAAASNTKTISEKLSYDQLALKAPLASPPFTGTPTAPTPTIPTGIANKAYVDSIAISALIKQPNKAYVLYHATAGTNNLYLSAATYEHNYAVAGAYLITISGTGSLATVDWGDRTSETVDFTGGFKINYRADKNKYIEVRLGSNCASIGDYAFEGCSGLTSITIPDSVTSIGNNAFTNCSRLTSITIPDSVTSIGEQAFYGCSGLTSITIPDSVTSIGNNAFYGCSKLTSIAIPDSVTSIDAQAFYGCSGLTSVNFLGNSLPTIGSLAFVGCRIADIIAQTSALADSAATAITTAGGTLLTNYRKLY